MATASSASCTCGAERSRSVCTAIVWIPRSWADLMIRRAISPRLAMRSRRIMEWCSHPEDAVGGFGDRRVGRGLEPHAEDTAGVDGVDDAVVPEARGRVVRRALVLVLVADGRLEGLLVLGRPLTALPLDAIAPDG